MFVCVLSQNVNCRQYYGESSEAHAKAYEGLAVSLGPGGDGTSIGSILTQPILATGTETLLTVEPKVDKLLKEKFTSGISPVLIIYSPPCHV